MSELIVANLTEDEQSFCLAVVEYGGNLLAAYRAAFSETRGAMGLAQELVSRPEIAARIKQIYAVVDEHAYFSVGSHLAELANIRDLAKTGNDLKTALQAEQARGQVMGVNMPKTPVGGKQQPNAPLVSIHIGASSGSHDDWARRHGNAPIIIEAQ